MTSPRLYHVLGYFPTRVSPAKPLWTLVFFLCVMVHSGCIQRNGVKEVKKEVQRQEILGRKLSGDGEKTDWERKFQEALAQEILLGKAAFFQEGMVMDLYLSNELLFPPEVEANALSEQGKKVLDRSGPIIAEIVGSRIDLFLQIEFVPFFSPSVSIEKDWLETYERVTRLRMALVADYLSHQMEIDPSRILLGETPDPTSPPSSSPRLRIVLVPAM